MELHYFEELHYIIAKYVVYVFYISDDYIARWWSKMTTHKSLNRVIFREKKQYIEQSFNKLRHMDVFYRPLSV